MIEPVPDSPASPSPPPSPFAQFDGIEDWLADAEAPGVYYGDRRPAGEAILIVQEAVSLAEAHPNCPVDGRDFTVLIGVTGQDGVATMQSLDPGPNAHCVLGEIRRHPRFKDVEVLAAIPAPEPVPAAPEAPSTPTPEEAPTMTDDNGTTVLGFTTPEEFQAKTPEDQLAGIADSVVMAAVAQTDEKEGVIVLSRASVDLITEQGQEAWEAAILAAYDRAGRDRGLIETDNVTPLVTLGNGMFMGNGPTGEPYVFMDLDLEASIRGALPGDEDEAAA